MNLTSEVALAAKWEVPAEKFAALRNKHKWEHVRLDRFSVFYTDAQVDAIVRSRTVAGLVQSGRTPRPARVVKR